MTCIQMLEKDWNFIKDYLQAKGQIIQIFMNLIFGLYIRIQTHV